jgi:hypothetical protein
MKADNRRRRLSEHVAECAECQATPLPLDAVGALLDAAQPDVDVTALSRHTFARLQPELRQRAGAISWRRAAAGVLLALLPLPIVLAYDAYVLQLAYDVLSTLVPRSVAAYLVLSYGAGLLLLFATTYAAIPVLMSRRVRMP